MLIPEIGIWHNKNKTTVINQKMLFLLILKLVTKKKTELKKKWL